MTSSFTQLEKWWLTQIPIGSMLLWRLHCFHGHTSSLACSLHRDMTNHRVSCPAVHKPTHAQRRRDEGCNKAAYRCPETRFAASCRENLSEKAQSKIWLKMWYAWHFLQQIFPVCVLLFIGNQHKSTQRFSRVRIVLSKQRTHSAVMTSKMGWATLWK